jgi:hypothetical protein
MKKKNYQEINFTSGQDRKGKSATYEKRMQTIRCLCGMRILVVPDLKAMNRAIKNHIAKHKQSDNGSVPDSLEKVLTEQVLIVASKMSLPNVIFS